MTSALLVVLLTAPAAHADLNSNFSNAQGIITASSGQADNATPAFTPVPGIKKDQAGPASLLIPQAERETAPDFTRVDRTGNNVSLSQYQGQVVILDLFGTWCGPCRSSIPHIVEAYPDLQQAGIVMLGVGIGDTHDTINALETKLIAAQKITAALPYPIVADQSGDVLKSFKQRGVPTYVVIDKLGRTARIGHSFSAAVAMAQEALGE
jgi:peroxiredoxin